jgi:hypothetical protein
VPSTGSFSSETIPRATYEASAAEIARSASMLAKPPTSDRGDLCDVLALATLCFPEPEKAAYQDQRRQLREQCSSVSLKYPLPEQD